MGSTQVWRPPLDRVARGEAAWPGAHQPWLPPKHAQGHDGAERPPLDAFVMRSAGDWIHGSLETETSDPKVPRIIGTLVALLQ